MKIKYYKQICKFCDKVLLSKGSTKYTYSISALHVLKEHPVLLSMYFKNKSIKNENNTTFFKKLFVYLKNFIYEKKNFKLKKNQKTGSKVLILSNLINESFASKEYDFYFGNIEKNLNKSGIKTLTVLRNFTNDNSKKIEKLLPSSKILLFKKTGFIKEIFIIYKMLAEYLSIKRKFKIPKINNLKPYFLSFFSMRSMVNNLRLYYQLKELIIIIKPSLFIIPYEGHAWERLIIKMVKELNIKTKIATYQFSISTKHQHSLFRPLKKEYNPELILTSGNITKKYFQEKYSCEIKILGSNKYKKPPKINKKKNVILIIPEAFHSETDKLLNFTIDLAKILPSYKFIFRFHPMMERKKFDYKILNYKNIQFSKNTLEKDLFISKFVLFRGSAAVFEAVINKVKPIYLDIKDQPNINPFIEFFPKNYNVQNVKQLLKLIKLEKKRKIDKQLIKFANDYFTKINLKAIKSSI